MSTEQISALRADTGPKPGTESTIAAGTDESRLPRIPEELSILPVRGFVVFPGTVVPLNIQRAASIKLLDDTLPRTKVIGLLAQRDEAKEDPEPQDLYGVGTAVLVMKLLRQTDDHVLVIAQGLRRFSLRKIVTTSPSLRAEIELLKSVSPPESKEWEATFRNLRDSAARLFELTPDAPEQARLMVLNSENAEQLADFLAPNLNVDVAQKQAILEELDVEKRVRAVQTHLGAARDCGDSTKTAKGCGLAIFRCATARLPAFANQGDSARVGRRRGWQRRTGAAIARATRGSQAARRSNEAGRTRIEAARFYSAGQPGIFRHRQLHRDHR